MSDYIDGFAFPIAKVNIEAYQKIASQVAEIWTEYGALAYFEYLGDDMQLAGTKSFGDLLEAKEEEQIVFGWVVFPSKEVRDLANEQVPKDPRMSSLVAPLVESEKLIFDASRMAYGGFKLLVHS